MQKYEFLLLLLSIWLIKSQRTHKAYWNSIHRLFRCSFYFGVGFFSRKRRMHKWCRKVDEASESRYIVGARFRLWGELPNNQIQINENDFILNFSIPGIHETSPLVVQASPRSTWVKYNSQGNLSETRKMHPIEIVCHRNEINEFRTTVLCSNCRGKYQNWFTTIHPEYLTSRVAVPPQIYFINSSFGFVCSLNCSIYLSRTPHRFHVCLNCGTVWHRNINAGNNMFCNTIDILSGRPLHANFARTARAPPSPPCRQRRPADEQRQ